ncbi:hypothetical protein Goarm_006327 [Gossypium armourianum]|uniref:Uncharacterized protein n=1 Tax=Gossypium armourianum TaxID=34283 RepID=A0A7J9JHN0_9ROSI|nr:hypothetical protein [Gossypium armourianum]
MLKFYKINENRGNFACNTKELPVCSLV